MADDKSGGPLVRAGADGIELSEKAPSVIARLLPTTWIAQRAIDHALLERVKEKIRTNTPLDEFEIHFAEANLNEHTMKFLRLQRIQQRTAVILPTLASPALPQSSVADAECPEPGGSKSTTSDDWVNKFREDASLVDDEVVQEVYARILATESTIPGSITLKTLGVLRYLDGDVARAFGTLQNIVINGRVIPRLERGEHWKILDAHGLKYERFLALEDAGLLHFSHGNTVLSLKPPHTSYFAAHELGVHLDEVVTDALPIHPLTRAGIELSRIAKCTPAPELLDLALSLVQRATLAKVWIATGIDQAWDGLPEGIGWKHWDPPKSSDQDISRTE